jgi:hypothetical protein
MAADSSFKKVIGAAGSGKKFPVMSLVRENPELAATIAKLIPDREIQRFDNSGNREPTPPNVHAFKQTSARTAQNSQDSKTVMQLLPDMELSAQILISSILSPKDMMSTELTYSIAEGLMSPEISSAMIARAKTYFEQDYKIKPLLPKMLRAILFEDGSYPVMVIPESSIDEVINGQRRVSFENLQDTINKDGSVKSKGLLGPAVKAQPTAQRQAAGLVMESLMDYAMPQEVDGTVTLESAMKRKVETFLSVTDNFDLLKIPQVNQKIREQRIIDAVGSRALESMAPALTKMPPKQLNDREMAGLVYKDRTFNYKPITTLKTQEQLNRRTVGNPLVMHVAPESVIPVYVPGCPEQQVGFFLLIDADGHPVAMNQNADYYQELSSRLNSNGSFPSAMLTRVKSQMSGFDINNRDHLDYTARAYGDMVEQDLLARLRNGVYGNGVALAKKEEIYRIMFARALAKQHTQLLFVPVELMTYFAFRYTDDGIGKSLMEDMKILNSLRSMLMFANVMASVKNSIGRTNVKLKLDESDPNPQKSIEIMMHETIRSRQQYFPLGVNSPTDLTDWLQRAGFEFVYEGHPGLPDVQVEFGQKNDNYNKPDSELEENLRKRAIMSVGLSPETVDNSFNAEFATSVVTNNILLSKRVMTIQEQFCPLLADHLRKCMMNSEELVNDLREILLGNFDKLNLEETEHGKTIVEAVKAGPNNRNAKDQLDAAKRVAVDQFLSEFIMNFTVELPRPNSATLENQLTALETYTKALDAAFDSIISDRFFTTDTGGEIANQVNTMREVAKAYYVRQWMAENGVLPELAHLTNVGQDGKPTLDVFDIQKNHLESLTKTFTQFMVNIEKVKNASNTVMDAHGGVNEESTTSSSGDGGEGGDGGDGGGGGDDFNFDMGGGGGDDPFNVDANGGNKGGGDDQGTGDNQDGGAQSDTDQGTKGTEDEQAKPEDDGKGTEEEKPE